MNHAGAARNLPLAHTSPLYERATDAILDLITEDGLQPGDRLPAESALAAEFGISRSTLREALMELKNRGVIDRRHGVGTFLSKLQVPSLHGGLEELKSLRNLSSRVDVELVRCDWRVERVGASEEICRVLQLESAAPVIRIRSAASIEGARCATLDSFVSEEYADVEALEDYAVGSLLDYVMEQESPRVAYTNSDIFATVVEGSAARWLLVDDGTPVLHLTETFFTADGIPVLFSLNNFRTEIISFHIVRRVV